MQLFICIPNNSHFSSASIYIVPALAFGSSFRLASVPFQLILALESFTFPKALVPFIGESLPCFFRALWPWVYSSLLIGPWIPDFSICPGWLHPSQSKEGQGFPLMCQPPNSQMIPLLQTCSFEFVE